MNMKQLALETVFKIMELVDESMCMKHTKITVAVIVSKQNTAFKIPFKGIITDYFDNCPNFCEFISIILNPVLTFLSNFQMILVKMKPISKV